MIVGHKKLIVGAILVAFIVTLFTYVTFGRETLLEKCTSIEAPMLRSQCLIPYFKQLTADESAIKAITVAKDLQKQGVIDDCHIIAHVVGGENLRKNNNDAGKAFSSCTMACIEGCYHGVMEEFVKQKSGTELRTDELLSICTSVLPDTKLMRQCLHGVGHGLLRHGSGSLKYAMDMCNTFPDEYSRTMCLGGVFMQNVHNIITEDEETFKEKIQTVCTPTNVVLSSEMEDICVEAIGPGIMFYTGHDLEKTKSWCLLLPEKHQKMCISTAEEELKLHNSEVEG